ncbi:MAG: N-acetylmuramic acid 6-phosphate etherase [Planctomycetota bacterium]
MTFLGLDVGGTHCRFEWAPSGVLPGGDARTVQPAVHGIDATIEGLATALASAFAIERPDAVVCALAGVGDKATATRIAQGLKDRRVEAPVAVVGDVLAAATAALQDGPGVLVWAGTGSFAIARSITGELLRVGGRGYLLGDQGSGYDLVRRAAAGVLLAVDGMGPPTSLTGKLCAAFDAPSPQRLGAVLQRLDSGAVAAKAPLVFAAAAAGDEVAEEVVAACIDALAVLALGAARQAGLDGDRIDLALGGGVLTAAPGYAAALGERLGSHGFAKARIIDGRAAARGAARLAMGWAKKEQPFCGWVDRVAL